MIVSWMKLSFLRDESPPLILNVACGRTAGPRRMRAGGEGVRPVGAVFRGMGGGMANSLRSAEGGG